MKPWKSLFENSIIKNGIRLNECLIVSGIFREKKPTVCLFKCRDRLYRPDIRLVKTIRNGVEMCYLRDLESDWSEGINEFGIGIVNTALLMGTDKKDKVKKKDNDGRIIRKALEQDNLKNTIKVLTSYMGGLLLGGLNGFTFVSDRFETYLIENIPNEKPIITKIETKDGEISARTNHGFHHPMAGYKDEDDRISSYMRHYFAHCHVDTNEGVINTLRTLRTQTNPKDRFNASSQYTKSQMAIDLSNKIFYFVNIDCKSCKVVNNLPQNYKSKIGLRMAELPIIKYSKKTSDDKEDEDYNPQSYQENISESFYEFPIYYFSYGANMSPKGIYHRIGYIPKSRIGFLNNYEFVYNVPSKDSQEGWANIHKTKGEKVYGKILEIKPSDLIILDKYEDKDVHYELRNIIVHGIDGNSYDCFVFIGKVTVDYQIPVSQEYIDELKNGIKGLPAEYVQKYIMNYTLTEQR